MTATVSARAGGDVFVLPASFAQQRLWFLDQLEPLQPAYNIPIATRVRGPLELNTLTAALSALTARHEALRTSFKLVDGEPHQLVHSPLPLRLELTDLSATTDGWDRALELVTQEARRPFDLAAGPLLRASAVRLASDDHVLMLTLHHIIADGWSIGVVNRELSQLYGALSSGEAANLPDRELQYADYASWQRDCLLAGVLDGQLAFWREELEGVPSALALPTDRPRPPIQSFAGAMERSLVPAGIVERLRALGDDQGATLFMTLLSAFGVLMHRYSGQDDIVVGSPVAGRGRVELEGVVGLFANTLPLRIRLGASPTFRELLARVRNTTLGAYANQDVPFERLVEEVNPDRSLGHSPIAQVLVAMQNAVHSPLALPGLDHAPVGGERGTSKFDLALFLAESPDGVRASLEYCTELFDRPTIQRLLRHYHRLLAEVAADPDRRVDELPLLSERDRHQILTHARGAPSSAPNACVHELVDAQVLRTPDAVAVECGTATLTYAELSGCAGRLAGRLRAAGVSTGDVVAIAAERSPELVVAVLAVLKAGGAYLPIDPAYPAERIAFMLADSGARVLVTPADLAERLPRGNTALLILDGTDDPRPPELADPLVTPDDLAYVIYTSGSTGRPKGVAMPHRPLVNLLTWQLDSWPAPKAARTLQLAALSFDVAFQEIMSTLSAGGTLVLCSEEQRRDPELLLRLLDEHSVERLFLPFVALEALAAAAQRSRRRARRLREVITAGEQLKCTPAIRQFFELHRGCVLYNQYGPTETHAVTQFKLEGPPSTWPALPPIGQPIAGAAVHVLDARGELVPLGVEGELHLGGVCLARGYIGHPELTVERFLPDRFSDDPSARMYRSGDRGRSRPDGTLEYLGRGDDQVKIRGHRLELGEVEAVLAQHPEVQAAAVIALEQTSDEHRLVGYVVPRSQPGPPPGELRALLRRALPEFAVPAAYVMLAALPLTPSGKLDRRSLPVPLTVQQDRPELVEPRDDVELVIAELWRDVLGLNEPVGMLDGFFDLGGHSLLAVRLFAEIERRLGVRLPLAELFHDSTLGHLADLVRREQARGAEHSWPTIVQLRRGETGRPSMFIFPTIPGELLRYRDLISKLDPRQPIYGVQAKGIDGRSTPHRSIEEMTANYLDAIRSVQPHGPYLFCGYCFAGGVAFETARLLEAEGEAIELVVLIDSSPFGHGVAPRRLDKELAYARDHFRSGGRGAIAWFAMRIASLRTKVRFGLWYLALDAWILTGRPLPRWLQNVWDVNGRAMTRFVSQPANCRVVAIRAGPLSGRVSFWNLLARGGVEEVGIDLPEIDHYKIMFEPFVSSVAAELNPRLIGLAKSPTGVGTSQEGRSCAPLRGCS